MIDETDPCVWLEQGAPLGPISYQTKAWILKEIGKACGTRVLVETGSHDGKNLALLASEFDEIHSIEIMQGYFEMCHRQFAGTANVHLY